MPTSLPETLAPAISMESAHMFKKGITKSRASSLKMEKRHSISVAKLQWQVVRPGCAGERPIGPIKEYCTSLSLEL